MQISKYTVGIGFQVDKRQLKLVDKQMKQMEKSFMAFSKRLSTNFGKSFVLPELKVKKIKLDSTLNAQRSIQTDLNKIGRLLEVRVGNVRLNEEKITNQFKNVFQRAANRASINVKTISGTGGGGNVYGGVQQRLAGGFGGGSSGFGLGAALPIGRLGVAGAAAGGVLAAGAYGISKGNELRQLTATRETQRLKLDTAVGGDAETRSRFRDKFVDLADSLGINAEGQVDSFSRFLKQAKSSGLSAEDGFDLYKNVATATRGNGGTEANIEGQNYAISQILGLGYLRGEELNGQLADQNPAIKRFIMEAFAERTGKQGTEAFMDALSKRQVSVQDVLRGYELSAQEASGRVKELSNSIEGASARLQNMKFGEELERTVDGPMTQSALDFVEAQRKLQESMEPVRDVFYEVAAAGTSLAAKLLDWTADRVEDVKDSPAVKGEYSPEQQDTAPTSSASGRGILGVPDMRRLGGKDRPSKRFISPLIPEVPEWQKEADRYMPSISEMSKSFTSNSTSSVTVQPGALVIHTQAANADQLKDELTPHIKQIFEWSLEDAFNSTMIESPYAE